MHRVDTGLTATCIHCAECGGSQVSLHLVAVWGRCMCMHCTSFYFTHCVSKTSVHTCTCITCSTLYILSVCMQLLTFVSIVF